jgi:Rieske Fe-S protein
MANDRKSPSRQCPGCAGWPFLRMRTAQRTQSFTCCKKERPQRRACRRRPADLSLSREPRGHRAQRNAAQPGEILARFDPAALSEETRARAAEGVVAYSAICTHQACPVNMWSKDRDAFVCSCHGSVYDPRNGAEALFGPAPRPLPSLGLKAADGVVTVAAGFSSRVGGTVD